MTDYFLWEVIKDGNKVLKRTVGIVEQIYKPTFAEEKLDRKNEIKAKGTLLMALSNKDQLKFHSYKDAKFLMKATEKRYRGNKESKKVQKILLKQQYENFAASSLKTLDQTFDRNKADIETISLDDLYNKLKIYEPELTGSSSTSQNLQNVTFVSSNSTNSTNEAELVVLILKKTVPVENPIENALIAQDGCGRLGYKAASPAIKSFVNSSEMLENQENIKSGSDKGYHAVLPPYTGNYIPPKPDLMFIDEQVESESVDVVSNVASSDVKIVELKHESVDVKNKGVYSTVDTKPVRKSSFSPPIIKDWNFDDESEVEFY
nr:hypothetical protein [Tanacetum cinerariifolium]